MKSTKVLILSQLDWNSKISIENTFAYIEWTQWYETWVVSDQRHKSVPFVPANFALIIISVVHVVKKSISNSYKIILQKAWECESDAGLLKVIAAHVDS